MNNSQVHYRVPNGNPEEEWRGYLAILVFRYGGVSGAVRRIVSLYPGGFTVEKIKVSLAALYPGLHPAEFQVADCLERMKWEGRIRIVAGPLPTEETFYEFVPRESFFAQRLAAARQQLRQLRLRFA